MGRDKFEGTTQSWGQRIVQPQKLASAATGASQTFAVTIGAGGKTGASGFARALISETAPTVHTSAPQSSAPPPPVPANIPDNSEPAENAFPIIPVDTIVEVVRNTITDTRDSNLGCKSVSTIAMAAVSANRSAVAVLGGDVFSAGVTENSLRGQILNNLATVTPQVAETVVVLGSCINTKDEIKEALTEAQKIDLSITLRSKRSEQLEFNTLKKPKLTTEFVYNYFTIDEEDIDLQEDQLRDPLLKRRPVDVPRYVRLVWNIAEVTEPLTGTELQVRKKEVVEMKQESLVKPGGNFSVESTHHPFSAQNQKKNKNPYILDGVPKNVIDIHEPEKTFSAIVNNHVYTNSVSMTLNTNTQRKIIDTFPVLQVRE